MRTIALTQLAGEMAKRAGCDTPTAHAFVENLVSIIAGRLSQSGEISIKGLGTFRRVEIGDKPTVQFAPADSLANEVNAPFSIFSGIELDDSLTDRMLEPDGTQTVSVVQEPELVPEDNAVAEEWHETEVYETEVYETEAAGTGDAETVLTGEVTPPPVPPRATADASTQNRQNRRASHKTALWVVCCILSAIAGWAAGYLAGSFGRESFGDVKTVNISAEDVQVFNTPKADCEKTLQAADSLGTGDCMDANVNESASDVANGIAEPETLKVSSAVVTDTVRANRFLTTIAQEHYGKKVFWVYIYLENKDAIADPDKIAPNTVVVVPPAEKYGINAKNAESQAAAQQKAAEILGRCE